MLKFLFRLKHKQRLNDFIFYLIRKKTDEEIEKERLQREQLEKDKPKEPSKNNQKPGIRFSISGGSSDYYDVERDNLKRKNPKKDEIEKEKVKRLIDELLKDKTSVVNFDEIRELTFVEMVRLYIKEKNLKDPDVYKAGLMDRRLFSKIINDINYKPSKDTVISFIFALKLSLYEAMDLLDRAGYTLSHSVKRDIVIEYFIKEKEYDLVKINNLLYEIRVKEIGRIVD